MDKKGVTLIELMVVVAILGILAAIVIPGYIGYQKRAARTEAFSNLENLRLLQEQFYAENGRYTPWPDRSDAASVGMSYYKAGDTTIADELRGFKPGPASNLQFEYTLRSTSSGAGFTAVAVGKSGSRVAGESYTINEENNRNF